MIDLKALAVYARRCNAFIPTKLHGLGIGRLHEPSAPILDAIALTNDWLESWDEIEDQFLEMFAKHLQMMDVDELKSELVLQGVRITLQWIRVHGQVPRKFAALERLVIEDVQQMGEIE